MLGKCYYVFTMKKKNLLITLLFLVLITTIMLGKGYSEKMNSPACGSDEELIKQVIEYKDGKISLSKLHECISIWNTAHPNIRDRQIMSDLVACVNDYKNGEKNLSELLECVQTFNLKRQIGYCEFAKDCKGLNHPETIGEWACKENKCVWLDTADNGCNYDQLKISLKRNGVEETSEYCIKNKYWNYLNKLLERLFKKSDKY